MLELFWWKNFCFSIFFAWIFIVESTIDITKIFKTSFYFNIILLVIALMYVLKKSKFLNNQKTKILKIKSLEYSNFKKDLEYFWIVFYFLCKTESVTDKALNRHGITRLNTLPFVIPKYIAKLHKNSLISDYLLALDVFIKKTLKTWLKHV